ncbi:MAG TPA: VPDSG-CTERM sorting domain-containing protein [Verrucomicrobiae bacterium]
MKTLKALSLTIALASALTAPVQAIMINGSIDMSGTATLNNTLLGSASAATGFSAVTVGGTPTGSFTGTFGDAVTWSAFSWPSSTTVAPLWVFTDAGTGWTYSFNLDNVTVKSQDNEFLNLKGNGVLSITGDLLHPSPYDSTTGAWSFTISNPGGGAHSNFDFTFANSQTAVPDGGATIALLGVGLLGLGALRRKI